MIKAILNLKYIWMHVNTIFLSAFNLDHLAVPSSQLLSELITQVVVELEGQYTLPLQIWSTNL